MEIAGLTLVNRGASRVHDVFFSPEDTFSTRGHTSHDGIRQNPVQLAVSLLVF